MVGSATSFPSDGHVYVGLADEYDELLGGLSEATWRQGIMVELVAANLQPEAVVVDLGAGTGIGGRLMRELIPSVCTIGIDRSSSMLELARTSYARTIVSEMTALPLDDSSSNAVVAGFDTVNYLDVPTLERCLREVARCLVPGGRFIFDYSSPHLLRDEWRDLVYENELPDGSLAWCHRYDDEGSRSVSVVERRDSAGAIVWRERHTQFALDAYAMFRLAADCGLETHTVRDLDRPQFTPSSHTHVWVLHKAAS